MPIKAIVLRVYEKFRTKSGILERTPQAHQAAVTKLFKSTEAMMELLLMGGQIMGKSIIEVLVDGIKSAPSRELKLFHLTLFNVLLSPVALFYDLAPEWQWVAGSNHQNWDTVFDGSQGPEILTKGRKVMVEALLLIRWYKDFVEGLAKQAGSKADHLTPFLYYERLGMGAAAVLVKRVVPLSIQMISILRPRAEKKKRARNRKRL